MKQQILGNFANYHYFTSIMEVNKPFTILQTIIK